jgi:glycosyltransferase involved in cell wall biosynthesis
MALGGAEVLVNDFVRATREGTSHSIACLDAVGPLGEALVRDGVRVERLHRSPGVDVGVVTRLRALLAETRPDVVCAHQYTPWSYAAMAVSLLRPRPALVFVEHGRHHPDTRRPKRVLANRALFVHLTQRVLAVCGYVKSLLVENEGIAADRISVVYNGVDPARFDLSCVQPDEALRLRASLGFEARHKVVVCVARLHPVKDHPTLVRGFASAAAHEPEARLLIVGAGEATPLLALATELGVRERVVCAGARSDIATVYAASDVFSMASRSEGTSVTLLEAMLMERPVAVTDVGGNPEVVLRGVTGLLSPRADSDALATSLRALLADPMRRTAMGRAGRARVIERFTQARMHAGWLGALEDAARIRQTRPWER